MMLATGLFMHSPALGERVSVGVVLLAMSQNSSFQDKILLHPL